MNALLDAGKSTHELEGQQAVLSTLIALAELHVESMLNMIQHQGIALIVKALDHFPGALTLQ